jgi:predicted O-methyltransferase YrrM
MKEREDNLNPRRLSKQYVKSMVNGTLGIMGFELRRTAMTRAEAHHLRYLRNTGHWLTPQYSEGIRFDEDKYRDSLSRVCLPYQSSYAALPDDVSPASAAFYLNNPGFNDVDAQVLYSTIRFYRPRQIIEVGSGFSTRLMRQAIEEGGLTTHLLCIDPEPRVDIVQVADEHRALRVEDVPVDEIVAKLCSNDILFIDSSHTVGIAGDVPFLLLKVLPRLAAGVLVHIHDIFLPFEVPEQFIFPGRVNWGEQYMVHALLYKSDDFEILFAARYAWEYMQDSVLAAFPDAWSRHGQVPSSLWIRKVA